MIQDKLILSLSSLRPVSVTTSSEWPAGSYALLSSVSGCPGNKNEFSSSSWQHKGQGNNKKSEEFHLAGIFQPDVFKYEFCVKENSVSATAPAWEIGRYCVLRVGGTCPSGKRFIQAGVKQLIV